MTLASRSLQQLVAWQRCSELASQALVTCCIVQPTCSLSKQWSSMRSYSTGSPQARTAIFAACVLERLPLVKSPPPEWEAEYRAWTQLRKTNEGMIKQYPILDKKQKSREDYDPASLDLVPTTTRADQTGATSTMKRRLADKLVLLVKARQDPAAAAAAVVGAQPVWTFPFTAHKAGESIRGTAERALKEAIGPSQVYFVGNAPMAHLDFRSGTSSSSSSSSSSSTEREPAAAAASRNNSSSSNRQRPDGRIFFQLATVVNDPWDVVVVEDAVSDHAWVSKEELGSYIKDERLLALAHQML